MRCIPLREAQVDMVLAADIVNSQEMLLLKRGVSLSAQNLRMLKSWGIEHLSVELPGDDGAEDAQAQATIIDLENEILSRFIASSQNPVVREIGRVAAKIVHDRMPLRE